MPAVVRFDMPEARAVPAASTAAFGSIAADQKDHAIQAYPTIARAHFIRRKNRINYFT
jgi:hypothetical protein